MKLPRLVLFGALLSTPAAWAVTAQMQMVSNSGSGVFVFSVNGQARKLFCTQFTPNATTSPYVANVATLANLAGSTLALQNDPQALHKYQMVAILDLMALADPSIAVDVVRANRRIVDGVGPLTPAAQALYDFVLTANPANYDLTGFKIYTNAITQEVTGFDPAFIQICKVAGVGVAVGTNFNFTVAGGAVVVAAGAAPGGNCSAPIEVPIGSRQVTETIPSGGKISSVTAVPPGNLTSANLTTGTLTVNATSGSQTVLTFLNTVPTTTTDGYITVCKVAGAGASVGATSSFNVGGTVVNVPAGTAPGGQCSSPVTVPAGSALITETPPSGTALSSVSTFPAGQLVNSNLPAGQATISVGAGNQVIATFINTSTVIPPNSGYVSVCKVAGSGVPQGATFNFDVAGTLVAVTAGAAPGGNCSGPILVQAGPVGIKETLPTDTHLTGVSTMPDGLLAEVNLNAGTATVMVAPGGTTIATFTNTFIDTSIDVPAVGNDLPYQVHYVSNLNLADSKINITNSGATGASIYAGISASTTGAFCANVYAFSPDEQMVACCSCPVTPNGLVSLSAKNDLISNTLTPAVPTSLVVKLLATRPIGGSCIDSALTASIDNIVPGLSAWATTIHVGPTKLASTETPFLPATLSTSQTQGNLNDVGELGRLTRTCTFINAMGSGFGICRTCRLGGLGGGRL